MDQAQNEQWLKSIDAKRAPDASIKQAKDAIHGVFSLLPHSMGDKNLSILFFDGLEGMKVLYMSDEGEKECLLSASVEHFNPRSDLLPVLLGLSSRFSRTEIERASDAMFRINMEHPRNQQDIERIAEDLALLFSELPDRLNNGKESISIDGDGDAYALNALVNMPNDIQRLSWFVSYVPEDGPVLDMTFAPMGADDAVDYWHDRRLTRKDILFGMKRAFGIDLDAAPAHPDYAIRFSRDPKKQVHMQDSLGLDKERIMHLCSLMDESRISLRGDGSSLNEAFNEVYERVTKECRTANELFFIGYLCGQGY